ncbi:MAG TPA: chitobiase/beta-hexosaminidase C-terminal domain-containing protein, partial [Verrucomicrobiae bacterium]|nr:chitobiase/beta-hexosaminidase C-terminal domain-containing protein [Verrucomicrobiae bacterium]
TVSTPNISPAGGSFTSSQQVTLGTATAGAEIRYTTDGSEPGAASALYAGAFTVSSSTTIKAKGFKSGAVPSGTAVALFTITAPGGGGGSGANKAVFVGSDTGTRGNWRGVYGSEGYIINGKVPSYPGYAQVTVAGKQDWVWNDLTSDGRGLLYPEDSSKRIASCWYGDSFTVDLNFTDGLTHRVSAYFCDWDASGRSQTIEVLDGSTGAVLWSQTLSGFLRGQYSTWDLKGSIKIRLNKLSGFNAVVNGLFFQPAPAQL